MLFATAIPAFKHRKRPPMLNRRNLVILVLFNFREAVWVDKYSLTTLQGILLGKQKQRSTSPEKAYSAAR
jgi:hypothetical protein